MRVLVVNAGSSSLKLTLLSSDDAVVAERELHSPRTELDAAQLREALDDGFRSADAIGHRIVHGGDRFSTAVVIEGDVEERLHALVELAPLHQPKSLAALDAISAEFPDLPAVACFDTAFHTTLAPAAYTYALPNAWRERWGLRRYGFHGLSHAWVARRVPELLRRPAEALRIVSCHLGAGASLCAIADGRSVDTTMGFTPLEGIVMATRSGSVDPGLLLWLLERGVAADELGDGLEHEAGLLGLAGTADMQEVIAREASGDRVAREAIDIYLHRLRSAIGSMVAVIGGLDALAFTGGIGEHGPRIRAGAVRGLEFLGLALSPAANERATGDADISDSGAPARALVIRAREDMEIARQARAALTD